MKMQMKKRQKSQYLFRNRWIDRQRIVRNMEAFQDLIVIVLCLGIFAYMVIELWQIFTDIVVPLDHQQVTAKILFLLILVELFRLLMVYLQEHSIAVGVAVEVTIVSVLREVVVHGVLEISWVQTASICGLLFILGGLLLVCAKTPHMDHMISNSSYSAFNNSDHEQQENGGKLPRSTQYEEIG